METKINKILIELNKIILGRNDNIKIALASVLVGGHILIEDRPGVGKTTLARFLSKASGLDFNRIQFTSDLLPSDILGFFHLDNSKNEFIFKKGPIFTDILLADEINRGSSRTQSAFLQAMEEKEISIENSHFKLSDTFCVIATQNQLDHIGTHRLPESQLDRFCISMSLGSNSREIEKEIIKRGSEFNNEFENTLTSEEFDNLKQLYKLVSVSEECYDFILDMVNLVRVQTNQQISIRASQDIVRVSKMIAIFEGRNFVIPKDLRFTAPYCLAHRAIAGESIEMAFSNVYSIIQSISDKV